MKTCQPRRSGPTTQAGVMLLEALIALLIFSVGILAIVAMQATAVQDLGESKYRTDASFLANQVIADMWANSANLADYEWDGSGAAPAVLADWVSTVNKRLPGTAKYPPTIQRDPATNAITVTVSWQQGRDVAISAPPHSYRTVAYINCCN